MIIRSLTYKWIAILLVTSLVGVVLVGLFAYRTTVSGYDQLRVDQARTTFISEVTTYYQDHNSWDGIEDWLHTSSGSAGPQLFALANTDGIIVSGGGAFPYQPARTGKPDQRGYAHRH